MKLKIVSILAIASLTCACQKKPDAPAPQVATVQPTPSDPTPPPTTLPPTTPPPPVTNCQGATVLWSLTPPLQTVNDNSSKDFVVPGFELSCGDLISVYFRGVTSGPTPAPAWIKAIDYDNGATYYSIVNQTVTFHNRTGIVLEIDIEATLK